MTKYQLYARLVKREGLVPDAFTPYGEPHDFMTTAILKAETLRHNIAMLHGDKAVEIKVEPVEAV